MNPTYETLWRNKWLTADCHSLEEMANRLESAAKLLKEMSEDGLVIENADDISDDYAFITTTNKVLAEKYGLCEREDYEDEDDDEI